MIVVALAVLAIIELVHPLVPIALKWQRRDHNRDHGPRPIARLVVPVVPARGGVGIRRVHFAKSVGPNKRFASLVENSTRVDRSGEQLDYCGCRCHS
jgi:hypothetical protein